MPCNPSSSRTHVHVRLETPLPVEKASLEFMDYFTRGEDQQMGVVKSPAVLGERPITKNYEASTS